MSTNPPTLAFDLARDIKIVSAMASNLTPYLYEHEMYGYLAGDLPRLTLGGLLLRLHRLTRLDDVLTSEQQPIVQEARLNFEAECSQWAVHYENKIQHELNARLHAFEQFLRDCNDNLQSCAAGYPSQAEKRTMIEHLCVEAEKHGVLPDNVPGRISQLDQKLQRIFREGEFIIADEQLQRVYPRDQFWWLYGCLIEDNS